MEKEMKKQTRKDENRKKNGFWRWSSCSIDVDQLPVDGTVHRMRFIDLFICQTKPIYRHRNYFAVEYRIYEADLYGEFSLFTFNVTITTNIWRRTTSAAAWLYVYVYATDDRN